MVAVTDADKARQARIERIAMILEGQSVGTVQTAYVYFNERTATRAEAIAEKDRERLGNDRRRVEGKSRDSLQAAEARQITTTQNTLPTLPSRTTSHQLTRRHAINDNSLPFVT